MKFFNLGGATGVLEHNGVKILFDPWLDEGIFHGAWHHYPPVNLPNGIKSLGHLDYIYISHIHEDHCSLGTLRELNADAEIIIMDRRPNFVLQFLEKNDLKFKKIHLVKPHTPLELRPGLIVDMVTADPAHELNYLIDSGLLIKWDGINIYNSNDCPPYKEALDYVKKNYNPLHLAMLPYATGSSYPACFTNLSHEEKLSEKSRLFKMGIGLFNNAATELKAKYVMPFADQYVIVGSKHELNSYMPHPAGPGVLEDLYDKSAGSQLLLLNSGQSFDLKAEKKIPEVPFKRFTEEDMLLYAKEHSTALYDHEKYELSKTVKLGELLKYACQNLFNRLNSMEYRPSYRLAIEVTDWGKLFIIDLEKQVVEEMDRSKELTRPYLKASVPANLLSMLLIGHVSWNIADAALFIDYERVPNSYDPKIHSLWNYIKI